MPPNPNRLLVEGEEDKRIIPQLMDPFVVWGPTLATSPVHIEAFDGISTLLRPGVIETELKASNLRALGVLVDADLDPTARWRQIRARVVGELPGIPTDLPHNGLIHEEAGRRFGVWLMPDNTSHGMIETFLGMFVRDQTAGLWPFVRNFCDEAKSTHGAPWSDTHRDKASIHAWLAVQEPPGQQLHVAILTKVLEPDGPLVDRFVDWFRELYRLPPK